MTKRNLTSKQASFLREFPKDHNATKAALRAGYAPSSAYQRGYELVRNSEVHQRLAELGIVGLDTLQDISVNGRVEIARVGAAKVLVEMAYGKPTKKSESFEGVNINILKIS
jgi:phage terminase small subunit